MDLLWLYLIYWRHYPHAWPRELEAKEPGWVKKYLTICYGLGWVKVLHEGGRPVAGFIARPVDGFGLELHDVLYFKDSRYGQYVDFAYGPGYYTQIIEELKALGAEYTGWCRSKHDRVWIVRTEKLRPHTVS